MSLLKSQKFKPSGATQESKEIRGAELDIAKEFPVE
jgi:hypothetical protein